MWHGSLNESKGSDSRELTPKGGRVETLTNVCPSSSHEVVSTCEGNAFMMFQDQNTFCDGGYFGYYQLTSGTIY